ncbi:MAG: hypothetical protein IK010_08080 [Bacteroidales bacterium]|nr:hypothetical protein [Bacteroidales bacterium]
MKAKYIFAALVATLLCTNIFAQPRIAVLEFNAGVGILQSDVNGLSAMFNTYFSPEGYIVVERTRVSRVLEEQNIQVAAMTEEQRVRLGQILNVSVIIIGDVNYAMKQYNVDVRAVNVETGGILAKDGIEFKEGSSYREMMKTLAERISKKIPIVEFFQPQMEVIEKKIDPSYRPTGSSLRFTLGYADILGSLAYNYQITPRFMIGGGAGIGFGNGPVELGDRVAIPFYLEADLRTPRYTWSLFVNVKVGMWYFLDYNEEYEYHPILGSLALGGSHKNLNLGFGITTGVLSGHGYLFNPLVFFLSYNLPLKKLF